MIITAGMYKGRKVEAPDEKITRPTLSKVRMGVFNTLYSIIGDFEGKNYRELTGNPDYQHWIDSGGTAAFPNGETPSDFKKRCISEFEKAAAGFDEKTVLALVVHGGTNMSVLEKYAYPKGGYYDFQVSNAHGFITEFDGKKIIITERI